MRVKNSLTYYYIISCCLGGGSPLFKFSVVATISLAVLARVGLVHWLKHLIEQKNFFAFPFFNLSHLLSA